MWLSWMPQIATPEVSLTDDAIKQMAAQTDQLLKDADFYSAT